MFEVGDKLIYIPGGVEVTVVEVEDRHMLVKDDESNWVLDPVYEDEYDDYKLA